jgi:hypothetical protein
MNESKTVCMVPWLHRFTNEQGFHQMCCTGTGTKERLLAAQSKAESRFGSRAVISSVQSVIAHMEGKGMMLDLADFLYFSEKTDRAFNDSWRKACPELADLLVTRN